MALLCIIVVTSMIPWLKSDIYTDILGSRGLIWIAWAYIAANDKHALIRICVDVQIRVSNIVTASCLHGSKPEQYHSVHLSRGFCTRVFVLGFTAQIKQDQSYCSHDHALLTTVLSLVLISLHEDQNMRTPERWT